MNNVYGYCPRCGGLGMSRERRLNGNDRCENGHSYPSSTAVTNPLLPVAPATEHTADTERAAIVRWLRDEAARLRKAEFVGSRAYVLESTAYMIENGVHADQKEKA